MKTADASLDVPASGKFVGIWIRVSTEDQAKGESPQHHEARARHYAASKGWIVKEVYDLAGVSGKAVMDHPEAQRMLRDVKRGHISALIFSKLARLARNTKELLEFADLFRELNADLVSLQESLDTSTPSGRFFYTLIAALAEWERAEIASRVQSSVAIRAKLGKPINGTAPYGYQWKDKKLVIHPTEAPVRKLAYELYMKHRRKHRVSSLLNEMGHRTRTKSRWSDVGVGRILTDWSAKGVYRYNVYRMTGTWEREVKDESEWGVVQCEPLVSETLWNEVNQTLETQRQSRAKRPGPKPVHLFAGLVYCHCGSPKKMYVRTSTGKYLCEKCHNKIPVADLEAVFVDELKAVFTDKKRLTDQLAAGRKNLGEKEQLIAVQQQEIQKVRDEMAKTHRLYLDGQIPIEEFGNYHKPLAERLTQLQTDLPRLQAEVDYLKIHTVSAEAVRDEADDLYSNWPRLPLENKRRVIEGIVDKIVIGKDEIEITFSSSNPLEEMTKNQQGMMAGFAAAHG